MTRSFRLPPCMRFLPRAWPRAVRALLFGALVLALLAAALWVKDRWLVAFLRERTLLALLYGAFIGLAALAWRALRVEPLPALLLAFLPAAALLVMVVNTPMPYELAHLAESLPRPEGALEWDARPQPLVEPPTVLTYALYPTERDLGDLTQDAAGLWSAQGWRIEGKTLPGDATDGRGATGGSFTARQGPLYALCAFRQEPEGQGPSMRCTLTA